MKKSLIIRSLSFSALTLLSVSCITKNGNSSDPYSNSNPYYGPQGAYTDNSAAAPIADSSGYVAPAPAESSYSAPPPPHQAPASSSYSAPSGGVGSKSHTVVHGDTLYSLARRYGTSVNAIKNTNGLNSNLIRLGQTLRIPTIPYSTHSN